MRDIFRSFDDSLLAGLRTEQKLMRGVYPSALETLLKPAFAANLSASMGFAAARATPRTESLFGLLDAVTASANAKQDCSLFGLTGLAADVSRAAAASVGVPAFGFEFFARPFDSMPETRFKDMFGGVSDAAGGLAEQLNRMAFPRLGVVEDILRMSRHLDAALLGSPRDSAIGATQMARALNAMDFRTFSSTMPLSGALRFSGTLLPETPFDQIVKGLARVQARPVGLASFAIGRLNGGLAGVSAQALAALTAREIGGAEAADLDASASPLMVTLLEIDETLAAQSDALIATVNALPEVFAEAVRASLAQQPKVKQWASPEASFVLQVVTLVASLLVAAAQCQPHETRKAALPSADGAHAEQSRPDAAPEPLLVEVLELQRRLAQEYDEMPAAAPACVYVTRREVVLRASRKRGSTPLATLYPGDVVEVLAVAGRRLRVRSCDYVRGEAISGWAAKKYFERL